MNYADLLAYIDSEGVSVETTFTTNIGQYIENAELKIQRDLELDDFRLKETVTVTASTDTATLATAPKIYKSTRSVQISGTGTFLLQKDDTFLDDYGSGGTLTGTPKFYALQTNGTLRVCPKPTSNTSLVWSINKYETPLSVTNTTNWVGDFVPDLYRAAMMIEVATFNKLTDAEMKPYTDEYTYRLRTAQKQALVNNRNDEYRKGTPTPTVRREVAE